MYLYMEHQDHTVIILRGKKKPIASREIRPKKNVDLHAIKLENDTEHFRNPTIPRTVSTQITQARSNLKMTQKEMAQKLGVQVTTYTLLENGKANYDGPTKQLINKIQTVFKIKFVK